MSKDKKTPEITVSDISRGNDEGNGIDGMFTTQKSVPNPLGDSSSSSILFDEDALRRLASKDVVEIGRSGAKQIETLFDRFFGEGDEPIKP